MCEGRHKSAQAKHQPRLAPGGLNVIALREIQEGEELTLDYALFIDESMEPFNCQCGSENCRQLVFGQKENSVSRMLVQRGRKVASK